MKKYLNWVAAIAIVISVTGCASTAKVPFSSAPVAIGDKSFVLTEVETSRGQNVVHSKDIPGGVYIVVTEGLFGNYLPEFQKIVRDIFIANNIKVTDKVEDANVAIEFSIPGYVKPSVSGQFTGALVAIAVGARTSGAAAVGALAGSGSHEKTPSELNASISLKPKLILRGDTGLSYVFPSSDKLADFSSNAIALKFKIVKGKDASYEDILKLTTQQWIDNFMIQDAGRVSDAKKI